MSHIGTKLVTSDQDIAENLAAVKSRVAAAAKADGRKPDQINLIAVSKTKPAPLIRAAITASHRVFGENRLQETEAKWPSLKENFDDVKVHLIGPLQRNKVKRALQLFDVIETVDRPKLARALARELDIIDLRPDCFLQVNTGEESQKSGVVPDELDAFVALCRDELALPVKGLMCLPPKNEEPAVHFGLLRELALRNGLDQLSMGMTADFETAIRFGATSVRVGTAIFGGRPHLSSNPD
jgi:pyridoxal phosphate enzyme (YggS family)